jgi:glycine cleavage system H protein
MANNPIDRYYTEEHEWLLADTAKVNVVTIGITDHAQESLGDIVMVELPEVGDVVNVGEALGSVESPKSVSDIFSPVGGKVVAINENLLDSPELINDDPYGDGWIVRIQAEDTVTVDHLMDSPAYTSFLSDEGND